MQSEMRVFLFILQFNPKTELRIEVFSEIIVPSPTLELENCVELITAVADINLSSVFVEFSRIVQTRLFAVQYPKILLTRIPNDSRGAITA